jgi:hypothetical protein
VSRRIRDVREEESILTIPQMEIGHIIKQDAIGKEHTRNVNSAGPL